MIIYEWSNVEQFPGVVLVANALSLRRGSSKRGLSGSYKEGGEGG